MAVERLDHQTHILAYNPDTYYRQDEDFISRIKPENKKTPADNRPEPSELCPRRDSNPGHAD